MEQAWLTEYTCVSETTEVPAKVGQMERGGEDGLHPGMEMAFRMNEKTSRSWQSPFD